MQKVLVVIDVQENFIRPFGDGFLSRVIEKIESRAEEGYEILFTSDRQGGKIPERLSALCARCKIYDKRSYGCRQLILDLAEKRPQKIEFIGVCTDICVIANVLGVMAFLPDADISVDGRCCASQQEQGHRAAIEVMKSCKIDVL